MHCYHVYVYTRTICIYIYIYMYIQSLLKLLDSTSPGDTLMGMGIPTLNQTLLNSNPNVCMHIYIYIYCIHTCFTNRGFGVVGRCLALTHT